MRPGRRDRQRCLATAVVLLAVLPGCESERAPVRVFSAASFTEAAEGLSRDFERHRPELEVVHAHGGSQVLRLQIEQGAPADVFVSASEAHVEALVAEGRAVGARPVARSELVLIVPLDNPAGVQRFEDLARAPRLVVGQPSSPIGQYTDTLFERATEVHGPALVQAIRARIVSEEGNVRRVRAKVELGEADAAIVYRADASPRVRVIPLPPALSVWATYYAAPMVNSASGARWVDHVEGPAAAPVLARTGFVQP